ncbi:hypothetical protein M5K25_024536 [Dendrobium thyrsiflorum]|uniref:DUF4283 domain-containing protein n=1 Tax=Dendrobium thyrsiflorum TaxID=117978 RepID=A0ABD0U2N4_DENTH
MDASASTAWGKASSPIAGKNKGFLNLEDEGKSPYKSRSFKDVLSGNDSIGELPTLAQSVFNGVPAVLLSDEEVLKLASPFQFTLVGKFSLRRPNLDMIRQFFGNLKLTGFFSIGLLDARHVSIQLTNDLDYSRVFARRSYFVNNCQMRILKWTPFFDIRQESPIVPIWISFPNLRLHFFNPKVLHALGSLFGRPLQTDQATAARTRPSVARVLVEVDITKKHAKEVWVGSKAYGYLQKVDFENIPDFCSHCKMHGHASTVCFKLHPGLKKAPKPTEEEDVPSSEIGLPAVNIDHSDQVRNVEQTPPHVVQGSASAPDSECVKLNVPVSNDIVPATITVPSNIEKSNEFFISIDSMLQNNVSNVPTLMNESQSLASTPLTNNGKVLQKEVGESREDGEFIPNESGDRETSFDNLKVSSSNTIIIDTTEDPHDKKKNDEVPFTMLFCRLDWVCLAVKRIGITAFHISVCIFYYCDGFRGAVALGNSLMAWYCCYASYVRLLNPLQILGNSVTRLSLFTCIGGLWWCLSVSVLECFFPFLLQELDGSDRVSSVDVAGAWWFGPDFVQRAELGGLDRVSAVDFAGACWFDPDFVQFADSRARSSKEQ